MRALIALFLKFLGLLAGLGLATGLALAVFALTLFPGLPSIEILRNVPLKVPLRVYGARGELLAEFGEQRRIPVRVDEVPKPLIQAVLAAEDAGFYQHPGVDLSGVIRAAIANLRSGAHEQGASTITMQVARNYFLTPEKTYTRKLKEMLLAFRIEQALGKNEILELYLNKIFLGHRAYGFAAAAKVYYAKDLNELTIPEMAMLAGLPKAPSRDNPLSKPDNARQRRDYVLGRMHKLGYLSQAVFDQTVATPLTAERHSTAVDLGAPYVAEMVREYMLDKYGEEAYWAGYKVYTTIVAENQRIAGQALRRGLIAYDRRHGFRGRIGRIALSETIDAEQLEKALRKFPQTGPLIPAVVIARDEKRITVFTRSGDILDIQWQGLKWARRYKTADLLGPAPKSSSQIIAAGDIIYIEQEDESQWRLSQLPKVAGALVSLRPRDGAILAITGGFDFYLSKFNRAVQAERQPGSNIKPFIYSAALSKGFTPASLVSGGPIVMRDESLDSIWRPENYSGKFFGPTRLREALKRSLNLVSVRILRAIDPSYAVKYLGRFGFDRERLPKGLSLALGTASLTPLQVVSGFAVFANGGYRAEPYFVAWVEDRDGRIVEQADPLIACGHCALAQPEVISDSGEPLSIGQRARYAPRMITPDNVFLMSHMMREVVRSGTGRRAMVLGRNDLAGKTGTTNDFRDAWFSGFNGDVVTTVWVGFDKPQTLGRREAGSRAALPIWIDYMKVALAKSRETPLRAPDNIAIVNVHPETAVAVPEGTPGAVAEYFVRGTEPRLSVGAELAVPGVPAARTDPDQLPQGLF